ncbi:hypothetical protein EI94DRAFT_1732774 [Lactarius quietus]|nr:hypothetical protein EI94DRAFT_1732774 [Lactarius quietus]
MNEPHCGYIDLSSLHGTILSFTWVKCARALKLRQVNLGPRLSKKLGMASAPVVESFLFSVSHPTAVDCWT